MKLSKTHKEISAAGMKKARLPENISKGDPLEKCSIYELLDQLAEEFEEFEEAILDCINNKNARLVENKEYLIECASDEAGDLLNVMSFLLGHVSGIFHLERD